MQKSEEIIIAGFGGQGVLSLGQMLAYSAMIENKEVSWMPSYGPEMRGGTANCIVIISDTRISSPIITKFDSAILLNQPSMDKFEKAVKPNGLIIYEESTVVSKPRRDDVKYIKIAALEEATKLNKKQVANMVLLGAFLELKPLVGIETILKALKTVLPERHHHTIPVNQNALTRGKEIVQELQ
ncbi:MAG: 2-oxoacid:ferredoxin oxidoreductase subunit gamma [Ignavibacteriales bacterium]|jgi:2-oxoglutarate ferredoxin oxidoreductase subunit gamma|nr:2-oxoacid:acceptor oxidoreductase family protein [Ignavibacteriaceae bacterium]NLH59824.1 2-oxoacid:ferredoxin oxidoreductase subunit gamma [Ignavibacteriales bacterium]HOJ18343.1 2-oxoacid:acceptor oxidoreductase family protein [Ignavibacteriaceae bacterium]HPO56753.1 2-oxoacid:acceptor oxidoreductase family protein [Ignavibacteriaceae bacterium]